MTQEKMFKKFDDFFEMIIKTEVKNFDMFRKIQFNGELLIAELLLTSFYKSNVNEKQLFEALIEYANGTRLILVDKRKTYIIESTVFIQNGKETYPYEHHFITFIFTEIETPKAPGLIEKLCNLFKK